MVEEERGAGEGGVSPASWLKMPFGDGEGESDPLDLQARGNRSLTRV